MEEISIHVFLNCCLQCFDIFVGQVFHFLRLLQGTWGEGSIVYGIVSLMTSSFPTHILVNFFFCLLFLVKSLSIILNRSGGRGESRQLIFSSISWEVICHAAGHGFVMAFTTRPSHPFIPHMDSAFLVQRCWFSQRPSLHQRSWSCDFWALDHLWDGLPLLISYVEASLKAWNEANLTVLSDLHAFKFRCPGFYWNFLCLYSPWRLVYDILLCCYVFF